MDRVGNFAKSSGTAIITVFITVSDILYVWDFFYAQARIRKFTARAACEPRAGR